MHAVEKPRSEPRRVHARLPAADDAPARARAALQALSPWVDPDRLEQIELVVSELVTNAVRHGATSARTPVAVDVSCDDERVRLSVADNGPGFDADAPRHRREVGGWGLFLVGELADRWWVERDGETRVVAELGL